MHAVVVMVVVVIVAEVVVIKVVALIRWRALTPRLSTGGPESVTGQPRAVESANGQHQACCNRAGIRARPVPDGG